MIRSGHGRCEQRVVLGVDVAVRWALDARAASVYVICMDCGLKRSEIDELIGIMRESGKVQSRAEPLAGYPATFEALPLDAALGDEEAGQGDWSVPCDDCAAAVLDAAGVE